MTEEVKPKARKARAVLPPNLYSGAYLLAQLLAVPKNNFILITVTEDGTRIYKYGGKFYTVPRFEQKPVNGYNWELIGRSRSRDMYVAIS